MIHGWSASLNHSLGSEWGVPANKANNYAKRKFRVRKFTLKMTPIDKLRCVFILSADAFCSKVSHTSLKGKNVSCKSHLAIFQSAHPNKKAIVITRAAQNNAPFRFWLAWELVAVGEKLMWELLCDWLQEMHFCCWPTLARRNRICISDHKDRGPKMNTALDVSLVLRFTHKVDVTHI